MGAKQLIRIGICLLAAGAALLPAARIASAQTAAPIRYVFGASAYTDSKGQTWSPVPASELPPPAHWHWSACAKSGVFTGTSDPGLYREQIAEDASDMRLAVPVPSGSYVVNLYFAEPCSNYKSGGRVFGVVMNGTTIVPRLDLAATAGVQKPVVETAQVSGTDVVLDLTRTTDDPVIAAIEILPALTSDATRPSSSFQITANLKWDDGTAVAGTVGVTQMISASPAASKSLGNFTLNSSGTAAAVLAPDLSLPLTFSFTLVNPAGATVNTLTFSCDPLTIKVFPRTLTASIVLTKSSATLKSFSF